MRDRIVDFRRVAAGELRADPRNWRGHGDGQRSALVAMLERVGIVDAVIARETPEGLQLVDGHLRADVLADVLVPVLIVDLDDAEAADVLATFDPLAAMADVDAAALTELLGTLEAPPPVPYGDLYDALDVAGLENDAPLAGIAAEPDVDEPIEPPAAPTSQRGDVWTLGEHRLMCGEATDAGDVARLLAGAAPDCLLTDPPYSSGGYQEASRSSGSVGRQAAHKPVDGDRLSTRGYMALIRRALEAAGPVAFAYLFCDWRQWVNLFDVVEEAGLGVRGMVVWDKMTPGMGRGWRSQHELILCATRPDGVWAGEGLAGRGNVIQCARTGNRWHSTEKPLDLVAQLVGNTPASAIYDPFVGSGTTILAAEAHRLPCYGMDRDAAYVDVAVERWQQATGGTATREPAP